MRLIGQDGKFYRMRRGKLVEIPPEWVGKTTHPQTIRKRPSKSGIKRMNTRIGRAREKEAIEQDDNPDPFHKIANHSWAWRFRYWNGNKNRKVKHRRLPDKWT